MEVFPPTRRNGKPRVSYGGYVYREDKEHVTSINWRCSVTGCKGRLVTPVAYGANTNPIERGQHCHGPDHGKAEYERVKSNMLREAEDTTHPPRRLLQNNIVGLSAEGAARVGSGTNLKQAIRRKRKRDEEFPREPRAAHDLIIPERFRITDAGQNFILYDSKDENGSDDEEENEDRLIILGTEDSLDRLRSNRHWFGDGTFKVSPTIFVQLFTLHFMFRSTVVPALYALMTNRTEEMYSTLFEKIKSLLPGVTPSSFMADFEQGLRSAFRASFPDCPVAGCFFHLGQSIYRKVQATGNQARYATDDVFRGTIKKMAALAFLPPDEVGNAFDALRESQEYNNETMDELFDYFEDTYIGRYDRRRQRRRPRYPIASWNAFTRLQDGVPRTNNQVEAWHTAFQGSVEHAHPTFFRLLDAIKREERLQRVVYEGLVAGEQPTRHLKKYVRINKNLRNLLRNRQQNVVDDLRSIAYNLNLNP